MRVQLLSGRCPYNLYQEECLQDVGVEAEIRGDYGMHLPDFIDEYLALDPDIIHLQWPESLAGAGDKETPLILARFEECFAKIKQRNIPIFWAHHNLLPHKRERLDLWQPLFEMFAQHCDVACHHSECGSALMQNTYDYGACEHIILRHGYFHKESTCTLSKSEARKQLGFPDDIHLYFALGALRKDKYIRELIDSFADLDPQKHHLFLAGNVWDDYGKEMEAKANALDNVHVEVGFVEDERVSLLATAADAFVYMYGASHLTSGSPHTSQAHLLPQISLDYDYAREVLGDGASYIAHDDASYENLKTLIQSLNHEQLAEQRVYLATHRDQWYWPHIAEQTKHAYEAVLAKK